ncbi:MAG: peptidase M61, partial [Candidatus Thiodiazotropha sp. 6PDIVS]
MIFYKLRLKSPQSHTFEVELTINKPDPDGQVVYLPAWIRGSYLIRDYARHITSIQALCNEEQIEIQKLDKQTWKVPPVKGTLTLNYLVYAWELSVRSAHFDINHAYFNGPALFLGVSGQEKSECSLEIVEPDDQQLTGWKVAYPITPQISTASGFGSYIAHDYETLIDSPAEIGDFSESEYFLSDCRHRFVVSGTKRFDHERICKHLRLICEKQIELFGEMPTDNYLFLL